MIVSLARDWETPIEQAPDIVKLVHLSMRMDGYDMEEIRADLLKIRRAAYEEELTIQAARVGCPGRKGRLNNGSILTGLNNASIEDARSIVNTYNYDLYTAIMRIRSDTPTANRYTYAKYLLEWSQQRSAWKDKQIAEYAINTARSQAQSDFYTMNNAFGSAILQPTQAVCPVCLGWISRGEVTLRVALNNPPPYHVNCPHAWRTYPERVPKDECPLLWMGE